MYKYMMPILLCLPTFLIFSDDNGIGNETTNPGVTWNNQYSNQRYQNQNQAYQYQYNNSYPYRQGGYYQGIGGYYVPPPRDTSDDEMEAIFEHNKP
jgi:hypothetical protein